MHPIDIAAAQSIDDFNTLFWEEMNTHTGVALETAVDSTLATLSGQLQVLDDKQVGRFFQTCGAWLVSSHCSPEIARAVVCNTEHLWGASVMDHTDNVEVLKKFNVVSLFNVDMSTPTQLPSCRLVNFLLECNALTCWEHIFSDRQVKELFATPMDSSNTFFWRLTDKPQHLAIFLQCMEGALSECWATTLFDNAFQRERVSLLEQINTPAFAAWADANDFWTHYFDGAENSVRVEGMGWIEHHLPEHLLAATVALVTSETQWMAHDKRVERLLVEYLSSLDAQVQRVAVQTSLVDGHSMERRSKRLQSLNTLLDALPVETLDGWVGAALPDEIGQHPRVQQRILLNAVNGHGVGRKAAKM